MATDKPGKPKKTVKKVEAEAKQGVKFVKLSELPEAKRGKLNLDELWVIDPAQAKAMAIPKARLCGCRNVCLA